MEFELRFREYNEEHGVIDPILINKVVLDNAFLSVLVLDFIYMVSIEGILEIANKNIMENDDRKLTKHDAMYRGFLFPWRLRYMPHDYSMFKRGDYVIFNILDSGLGFSSGPRSCIGPGFFNKFWNHLLEILRPYELGMVSNNDIVRNPSENSPFITSEHVVKLDLPKRYLKDNL